MESLLIHLLIFVVVAAGLWALEKLFPAVPGQRVLRRGFFTDVTYWLFNPAVTRAVTSAGIVLVIALLLMATGSKPSKESYDTYVANRVSFVDAGRYGRRP